MSLKLLEPGKSSFLDRAFSDSKIVDGINPVVVLDSFSRTNPGKIEKIFPILKNRGLGARELHFSGFRKQSDGSVSAQGFTRREGASFYGFDFYIAVTSEGAKAWAANLEESGDSPQALAKLREVQPQLAQLNR